MENTLILEKENSIEVVHEKVTTPKIQRARTNRSLSLFLLYCSFITICGALVFAQWHLLALLLFVVGSLVFLWVYILRITANVELTIDFDEALEQKWLESNLYDPNTRNQ